MAAAACLAKAKDHTRALQVLSDLAAQAGANGDVPKLRVACALGITFSLGAGDFDALERWIYDMRTVVNPRFIINFPTKRHWKGKSQMPPLGAGNGGLDWRVVRPRIIAAFAALPDVRVLLFEPAGEPAAEDRVIGTARPALTTARALFISLMETYGIPDYSMTLLEVQKLAYFLQEAGQPLRLKFEKAPYGPYADNLNQVLRRLEGHYLHGATDTKPDTAIRLAEGAGAEAAAFLQPDAAARANLERVITLIEGFETPYGLELLATVHWSAKEDARARNDADECVRAVHAWNDRKARTLRTEHIRVARDRLIAEGFLA